MAAVSELKDSSHLLACAEIAGLKRKLTSKMAPEKADDLIIPWTIGDCLGKFFRPNFETLMYPYCPPHIVRPKEQKKLFIVALPEKAFFAVRSHGWSSSVFASMSLPHELTL